MCIRYRKLAVVYLYFMIDLCGVLELLDNWIIELFDSWISKLPDYETT